MPRLSDGFKTGSGTTRIEECIHGKGHQATLPVGLDTPKEKRIEEQLEKSAPPIVEEANEYQGSLLPVLFPGRDIYR